MRLALARALLGDPRLLLLDEADANLDAPTRTLLAKIISEYPGTVLMVTHDPQLIESADETWMVDDGRVAVIRGGANSTAAKVVDFKTGATQ